MPCSYAYTRTQTSRSLIPASNFTRRYGIEFHGACADRNIRVHRPDDHRSDAPIPHSAGGVLARLLAARQRPPYGRRPGERPRPAPAPVRAIGEMPSLPVGKLGKMPARDTAPGGEQNTLIWIKRRRSATTWAALQAPVHTPRMVLVAAASSRPRRKPCSTTGSTRTMAMRP
jgi:hypothetical protein